MIDKSIRENKFIFICLFKKLINNIFFRQLNIKNNKTSIGWATDVMGDGYGSRRG